MRKQQVFYFKFLNVKKKFLKINNFFFKKFIICSIFDPLDFNLVTKLNKIKLGENDFLLVSQYSRKLREKSEILKNLVCFSKLRTFSIVFDSFKSLESFLIKNKNLTFYFISFDNYFSFFHTDLYTNNQLGESKFNFFFVLSRFFFSTLNFIFYFFMFGLWNYTRDGNNIK